MVWKECPKCKGKGEMTVTSDVFSHLITCDECDGKGGKYE